MEEQNNCTRCDHFKFCEEWEDESGYPYDYYYCDLEEVRTGIPWSEAAQRTCNSWEKQPYEVN